MSDLKYGVVCTESGNFFFELSEDNAREWEAAEEDVIGFSYVDDETWVESIKWFDE